MPKHLIILLLLANSALAALPNKYAPVFYEHLQGKEKTRCEKYVKELQLMERRKSAGRVQPWELKKMDEKQLKIDKDYDRYCLRLTP